MKKILLASAIASLFSVTAHAQSSVTLYGIIDEGVQFSSNTKNVVNGVNVGGRQVALDSVSGQQGSRWGLKGAEDLGGGLQAVFTLESGINLNTGALGQGGTEFGRQAFVGLSSRQYGAVTLGRQYDSVVTYTQPVTTIGYAGSTSLNEHPGDLDNTNNSLRTNNTIKYASPSFNGLTFGAEVSLGGQAGNVTAGGGYNAGAAYSNGPLTLGAAYTHFKNPTGAAGTGLFTDNTSGATSLSGLLNSGYVTATSYQDAVIGGKYALGPATFGLSYSNVQYGNITADNGATAKFSNIDAGVTWAFTPTFSTSVAYDYLKGSGLNGSDLGNQHFNQVSLLADYTLSKRTDIYAAGSLQKASGTNSQGTAAVADIGNLGDSSNSRQALVRVAIRHKF
jgi:predicted porin